MKCKYYLCNLITIITLTVVSVSIVSCGSNDSDEQYNVYIRNIEGTYYGVFTDQQNHEKASEGNVTVKKISDDLYSLELICDGHNIHVKAEAVKIYLNDFGEVRVENGFGDNHPEWWQVTGGVHSDGLFLICFKNIFGEHDHSILYYFRQGKKRE